MSFSFEKLEVYQKAAKFAERADDLCVRLKGRVISETEYTSYYQELNSISMMISRLISSVDNINRKS